MQADSPEPWRPGAVQSSENRLTGIRSLPFPSPGRPAAAGPKNAAPRFRQPSDRPGKKPAMTRTTKHPQPKNSLHAPWLIKAPLRIMPATRSSSNPRAAGERPTAPPCGPGARRHRVRLGWILLLFRCHQLEPLLFQTGPRKSRQLLAQVLHRCRSGSGCWLRLRRCSRRSGPQPGRLPTG